MLKYFETNCCWNFWILIILLLLIFVRVIAQILNLLCKLKLFFEDWIGARFIKYYIVKICFRIGFIFITVWFTYIQGYSLQRFVASVQNTFHEHLKYCKIVKEDYTYLLKSEIGLYENLFKISIIRHFVLSNLSTDTKLLSLYPRTCCVL